MPETATRGREEIMEMIEKYLRKEREAGRDPTPTQIKEHFSGIPEIDAMATTKFSAGYVRLIKQRLNQERNGNGEQGGQRRQRRTRRAESREVRPRSAANASQRIQTTVRNTAEPAEGTNGESTSREQMHLLLFDFGSEFVHAHDIHERISILSNIDGYVERMSELLQS